jgi:hypothetical protein
MRHLLWLTMLTFHEICDGAPLLTITCGPPTGISIQHGISSFDQLAAMQTNKPPPTKQDFSAPGKDGYEQKPTFVLQTAETMTVVWQESERELKSRDSRRKRGLTELAKAPEAEDVKIISNLSPISITAIKDSGFQTSIYSFYPTDGIVFISEHQKDIGSKAIWSRLFEMRIRWTTPSLANTVKPNPSLNRSTNGGPPGPVWRYTVHFRQPGPGVPPLAPG